nr:hypothetical protein [Burkholderia cepacia]
MSTVLTERRRGASAPADVRQITHWHDRIAQLALVAMAALMSLFLLLRRSRSSCRNASSTRTGASSARTTSSTISRTAACCARCCIR